MKCGEVRAFLSQIDDREEPVAPVPLVDLNYLSSGGYVLVTTKEDYDTWADEVGRLSQMTTEMSAEKAKDGQAAEALQEDERKEHSFLFHLERGEEKDEERQTVQNETAAVSSEGSELSAMEANVNELIQKKSTVDRMVPYGGEYLSLTDLGSVVLNDLNVRNYRVGDEEFADFSAEIKATYDELRSIADRAASYMFVLRPSVPEIGDVEYSKDDGGDQGHAMVRAPSLLWGTAIGLAKLQGDTDQIGQRFIQALDGLQSLDSTTPNKLMAAEIMTALSAQDVRSLDSVLREMDQAVRKQGVAKELSAGVAATIMAGRRFDGSYPLDRFAQFRQLTSSYEAAAIVAVMNVDYDGLSTKFQAFRSLFDSWGYMKSEDTEIGSAFLAIGELDALEVQEKLKYVVEQLKNYLEYPVVAAAILASIPVFESHEVLDLMEKAVTLLSAYAAGLERSELVALAVRMIHGVRNELVKEIDSTVKIAETPLQFTYSTHPGLFLWYFPVIVAHSSYNATFSAMGGFHPAHAHGIGGFAG
ncbi:MAG: hypothetical protein OK454_01175 [Thaumarchaeota archaeon]|nr:hypothetical protein [Nitrososphaerota archaeon]